MKTIVLALTLFAVAFATPRGFSMGGSGGSKYGSKSVQYGGKSEDGYGGKSDGGYGGKSHGGNDGKYEGGYHGYYIKDGKQHRPTARNFPRCSLPPFWLVSRIQNPIRAAAYRAAVEAPAILTPWRVRIEFDYKYLMTSAVSTDPIERIFGIYRQACGANENPDPTIFIYIFRIFAIYGLLKPPKGSNVGNVTEVMHTLLKTKDVAAVQIALKTELQSKMREWVCARKENPCDNTGIVHVDHNEIETNSDDRVISHVSGWVVLKMIDSWKCKHCDVSFQDFSINSARHQLTNYLDQGGLIRSSDVVFELIKILEDTTLYVAARTSLCRDIVNKIVDHLIMFNNLVFVGCSEHETEVTVKFINYFLERRVQFLCNFYTKKSAALKAASKERRKQSKLPIPKK